MAEKACFNVIRRYSELKNNSRNIDFEMYSISAGIKLAIFPLHLAFSMAVNVSIFSYRSHRLMMLKGPFSDLVPLDNLIFAILPPEKVQFRFHDTALNVNSADLRSIYTLSVSPERMKFVWCRRQSTMPSPSSTVGNSNSLWTENSVLFEWHIEKKLRTNIPREDQRILRGRGKNELF